MEYTVKVVIRQSEMSDKEKADRITQFSQAFVTAAVDYYSNKTPKRGKLRNIAIEKK